MQSGKNHISSGLISTAGDGRIIDANRAACKFLGYSKKKLLTLTTENIFNTTKVRFKKMMAQRSRKGWARAHITAIRSNGKKLLCEVTSVVFTSDDGIKKAITMMVNLSDSVFTQKSIANAVADAQEMERSDISKELHDNVNQLLGLSRLYVDMARKDRVNTDMYLNKCSEFTLAAIEEIRKISKGLVIDVIRNFGLAEAINDISSDTMKVHPVKISCIADHLIETRVNDKFKQDVFRIVQEQLTNIIKHAKASIIKIGLSQNKGAIFLSISDNGAGFDTTLQHEGIGITNIKGRAASYSGRANFVSQAGKGCVLTVTFPVTDALLNKK